MLIPKSSQYYKYLVLKKMTKAFEPGDPVLEIAALGKGTPDTVLEEDSLPWIRKAEQLKIDKVRACRFKLFPFRKRSGLQAIHQKQIFSSGSQDSCNC